MGKDLTREYNELAGVNCPNHQEQRPRLPEQMPIGPSTYSMLEKAKQAERRRYNEAYEEAAGIPKPAASRSR